MMSRSARLLGGALLEASPSPAPVLALTGAQPSPPAIDLRPLCSPIENQLDVGSCVAQAVVGAIEYLRNRKKLEPVELSRLFVYYNARKLADRVGEEGTQIHHALAAVMAYGVCEEAMWPYHSSMRHERPTEACFSNATRYQVVEYARASTPDLVFGALGSGFPVIFAVAFPDSFYDQAWETGEMPRTTEVKQPDTGHAMLLVGYDKQTRTFIVRNSWGKEFGRDGYCLLPFETFFAYSPGLYNCWTVGELSQTRGFTLNGPTVAATVAATRAHAREQAISVLREKSKLREQITGDLEAAKKGFRDRLRGPGAGGGY
jgi:C1A family cysteine protease